MHNPENEADLFSTEQDSDGPYHDDPKDNPEEVEQDVKIDYTLPVKLSIKLEREGVLSKHREVQRWRKPTFSDLSKLRERIFDDWIIPLNLKQIDIIDASGLTPGHVSCLLNRNGRGLGPKASTEVFSVLSDLFRRFHCGAVTSQDFLSVRDKREKACHFHSERGIKRRGRATIENNQRQRPNPVAESSTSQSCCRGETNPTRLSSRQCPNPVAEPTLCNNNQNSSCPVEQFPACSEDDHVSEKEDSSRPDDENYQSTFETRPSLHSEGANEDTTFGHKEESTSRAIRGSYPAERLREFSNSIEMQTTTDDLVDDGSEIQKAFLQKLQEDEEIRKLLIRKQKQVLTHQDPTQAAVLLIRQLSDSEAYRTIRSVEILQRNGPAAASQYVDDGTQPAEFYINPVVRFSK